MTFADLLLLGSTLIWGANYGIVKGALASLSPLGFVATRFALAAAIMAAGLLITRSWLRIKREHLAMFFLAGACAALYQVFFIVGLNLTTSANSALLFAATPVIVMILSAALRTAQINARQVVGSILSFAGVYLVITGGSRIGGASSHLAGDLITIVSVLLWATHIYANTVLLRHYPSTPLTAMELIVACVILIPVCLPAAISQDWAAVTPAGWGGLTYAVIGSTVISYSCWNYGIRRIGPVRTLVYQYLTPVFALIFGVLIWSETVLMTQILGGAMVWAGVLLVRLDVFSWGRNGRIVPVKPAETDPEDSP